MTLLPKIRNLMNRSEVNRQRCELRILSLRRQGHEISVKLAELQNQRHRLGEQLTLERPQGQLNRAGLFSGQRRLAVLRRQLNDLALQEQQLNRQQEELNQQAEAAGIEQKHWRSKQDKYRVVMDRERQHVRLTRLRQEETELQEIMTCLG